MSRVWEQITASSVNGRELPLARDPLPDRQVAMRAVSVVRQIEVRVTHRVLRESAASRLVRAEVEPTLIVHAESRVSRDLSASVQRIDRTETVADRQVAIGVFEKDVAIVLVGETEDLTIVPCRECGVSRFQSVSLDQSDGIVPRERNLEYSVNPFVAPGGGD